MTTEEILHILNEKFGTIQDQSWFASLRKTANSKNITTAEWNSLLFHAARTASDTDTLKTCLEAFIQLQDALVAEHSETLEEHSAELDRLDALKAYDFIATTEEELANIPNGGSVLINGVRITRDTVLDTHAQLCFKGVFVDSAQTLLVKNASRVCGDCSGQIVLQNCQYIENFSAMEAVLKDCAWIYHSDFASAEECYFIDSCYVSKFYDTPSFEKCYYVNNIESDGSSGTFFNDCSYVSNINCEGAYIACKYVDPSTCKGFVKEGDVGKVQVLSNDGTFKTFNLKELNEKVSIAYKYKGSVDTLDDLRDPLRPKPTVGDVYNTLDTGMNYAWTGYQWDPLGTTIDVSAINAAIDKRIPFPATWVSTNAVPFFAPAKPNKLQLLGLTKSPEANKMVQRDGNGDLTVRGAVPVTENVAIGALQVANMLGAISQSLITGQNIPANNSVTDAIGKEETGFFVIVGPTRLTYTMSGQAESGINSEYHLILKYYETNTKVYRMVHIYFRAPTLDDFTVIQRNDGVLTTGLTITNLQTGGGARIIRMPMESPK